MHPIDRDLPRSIPVRGGRPAIDRGFSGPPRESSEAGCPAVALEEAATTTTRGAQTGGIVTQEAAVHASNVQVVCPNCSKPTRLGHRKNEEGRSVRTCRKCGADV